MASITLNKTWINLLDTGVGLSFYTAHDRAQSKSVSGEVRTYAGGRQRSVTAVGTRSQVSILLRQVTQNDIDTLTSWFGKTVVVRDHRGRRWFGVFYTLDIADRRKKTLHDVTITVYSVTYVEGT